MTTEAFSLKVGLRANELGMALMRGRVPLAARLRCEVRAAFCADLPAGVQAGQHSAFSCR
jgi:hypothetical protein